jgi:hypothetical protein
MDNEKNLFLRKLRNKIGYGVGWTFKDAFVEFISPHIAFIAILSIALWLASHTKVVWVP